MIKQISKHFLTQYSLSNLHFLHFHMISNLIQNNSIKKPLIIQTRIWKTISKYYNFLSRFTFILKRQTIISLINRLCLFSDLTFAYFHIFSTPSPAISSFDISCLFFKTLLKIWITWNSHSIFIQITIFGTLKNFIII